MPSSAGIEVLEETALCRLVTASFNNFFFYGEFHVDKFFLSARFCGFGLLFSILDRESFTAYFGFSHFFVFFGVKMWKE